MCLLGLPRDLNGSLLNLSHLYLFLGVREVLLKPIPDFFLGASLSAWSLFGCPRDPSDSFGTYHLGPPFLFWWFWRGPDPLTCSTWQYLESLSVCQVLSIGFPSSYIRRNTLGRTSTLNMYGSSHFVDNFLSLIHWGANVSLIPFYS